MTDRAELVDLAKARTRKLGDALITAMADQIEADGKRIAELEAAHRNTAMQAAIQAQEARTQRAIVMNLLRAFGCPPEDWNAESLITGAADTRALAAAEAVKEAAANKVLESDAFTTWGKQELAKAIRAIDCNAIVKGMK